MGYTLGTATDSKGNQYAVITDIRVVTLASVVEIRRVRCENYLVGAQWNGNADGRSSAQEEPPILPRK